jgi:3-phenylpropionate/trans-cinnamate dioxygenase ferredoxin component
MNYQTLPPEQLEFIEVAAIQDLPPGERLFLDIDGQVIVIFNIAGHLFAIGDVCSHDNGPLGEGELDQYEIVCPRHGARFDVRSGSVTALPAVEDIPAYPVRISVDRIEIGLPVVDTL